MESFRGVFDDSRIARKPLTLPQSLVTVVPTVVEKSTKNRYPDFGCWTWSYLSRQTRFNMGRMGDLESKPVERVEISKISSYRTPHNSGWGSRSVHLTTTSDVPLPAGTGRKVSDYATGLCRALTETPERRHEPKRPLATVSD